jgi:hypothetical protein
MIWDAVVAAIGLVSDATTKGKFIMSMGDTPREELPRNDAREQPNPFRENPYASPKPTFDMPLAGAPVPVPASTGRGMVGHVTVVAILMMVQGALEAAMGLMYVAMGGIFPVFIRMELDRNPPPAGGPPPEFMTWLMFGVYGGMGLLTLMAAGLHIFGGIRNYRFRSRTLGLVALTAGMVSMASCYCGLTAVALGVYGLVTYLNPEVRYAFALGAAGRKRSEILAAFGA